MLLEDFKKNLPRDIRLYVEENQVNTLHRAAELADEYHLIHYFNKSFQKNKGGFENSKDSKNSSHGSSENSQTKDQKSKKEVICHSCGIGGHIAKNCRKSKEASKNKKTVALINLREMVNDEETMENYDEHLSIGHFSVKSSHKFPITVLRDTGAAVSLLLKSALPKDFECAGDEFLIVSGFPCSSVSCPV